MSVNYEFSHERKIHCIDELIDRLIYYSQESIRPGEIRPGGWLCVLFNEYIYTHNIILKTYEANKLFPELYEKIDKYRGDRAIISHMYDYDIRIKLLSELKKEIIAKQ